MSDSKYPPSIQNAGSGASDTRDELDTYHKLTDGEPYFVLRGQDRLAPDIIREWAFHARREGVPQEKIEAARKLADAMEDWQVEHGRRTPD